jgi:general secretion pathway protein A
MYKNFFGLQAGPFGASPDPRFLYPVPQVREALACLEYGITSRKGFVVLTGEVGTGKTTLLKSALSNCAQGHISSAFVFNPRLDVLDFFEFVLMDFGVPIQSRTKSGMLLQLNRWLIERFRAQETCVIAIDEAQHLSWDLLEEIRLLTNLETSAEKLVQIVLSGQPELEEKLKQPDVRQLRQRVSVWARTLPLTAEETQAHVAERLRIAGATQRIFDPAAVDQVYRHAKGIPRLINLICEHALIRAYVEQQTTVSLHIVAAVVADLELDHHPSLLTPSDDRWRGLASPPAALRGRSRNLNSSQELQP